MAGVADFNGDGKKDILWHDTTQGLLYVWYMNGVTKTGAAPLSPNQIDPKWRMAGIADFNGDGKKDILWHDATLGLLYVWYMDGVTKTGGAPLTPNSINPKWRIGGIRDLDNDGNPDIVWQDTTQGLLYVWYMDGVTKISGAPLAPNKINPTWRMMGFGLLD